MVHLSENVGVKSVAKNYLIKTLPSLSIKILSSMVLCLIAQLQVFLQLYLREFSVLLKHESTQSVYHDVSTVFDGVWHAGVHHKLKTYGILGRISGLISSFLSLIDSSRWYWMESLCKSIYLMLLKAQFLISLFPLYINDPTSDSIYNIAINADNSTLYYLTQV